MSIMSSCSRSSSNRFCFLSFILLQNGFFSRTEAVKNPFEFDCRREPEPVLDSKEARKILKQTFTPELVPKDLDAIVIGSGIGGLSTAAILAKAGKKAGGCTHTFKEKGVEFDVGIHYIGEMMHQTFSKTYVDQITDGQLQWAPLEDAFDVVVIGEPPNERRYEITSGPKKIEDLKKYFPDDTKAIDEFYGVMKKAGRNFIYYLFVTRFFPRKITKVLSTIGFFNLFGWDIFHKITVDQFLRKVTDNAELRDVLAYCFGDYGTLPKDTPIGFHAILWKHFFHRVAYPVGGASQIARTIIPIIEKNGGKVLVSAKVKQILCKNGRAVGVSVGRRKQPEVELYAPIIISDAGVHNTFKKLLPPEVAKTTSIMDIVSKMEHGKGGFCVFVGLDGSNEELGLTSQNIWAFARNDVDKIAREYYNSSSENVIDMPIPLMFQSFPSAKDPTWDERFPGKSSMTIVTLTNYKWFENWKNEPVKKRSDDYNAFKQAIGENMVEQCLKLFPHLKNKINDVCVGSPLTHDHYIESPRGEIYGLDHTCYRFSPNVISELRPDTEIPGLYITGQDTMACGFSGALHGGLMCASSVLGRLDSSVAPIFKGSYFVFNFFVKCPVFSPSIQSHIR
ncbi:putative all-trans-retinol 13,14-reductase [Nymphon striatum]|nr:putative all-trans-retinol 13,14-reductase [Nymphon striatum]